MAEKEYDILLINPVCHKNPYCQLCGKRGQKDKLYLMGFYHKKGIVPEELISICRFCAGSIAVDGLTGDNLVKQAKKILRQKRRFAKLDKIAIQLRNWKENKNE